MSYAKVVNPNTEEELSNTISTTNVDNEVKLTVAGFDKFNNKLKMSQDVIPIKVITPEKKVTDIKTEVLQNNLLSVSF